jgi:polysaccharide export outer membrane protein
MTIMQALSEAGGLTDYAKRKKIYVLRSQDGKEYMLPFNYDAVLKGEHMELNIPLMPGDTIVVP